MPTPSRTSLLLVAAFFAGVLTCSALSLPAPALAVSDDPVLKRMDAVLEENAQLREEAWKLHKSGNREAARQAAEALEASEERVERTRAEALAHVAGISPAQVEALRKDGKSWGQASGELGVHPGFLGIGKTPLYESHPKRKAKKAKIAKEKVARGKEKASVKKSAGKEKTPKRVSSKPNAARKSKSKSKK